MRYSKQASVFLKVVSCNNIWICSSLFGITCPFFLLLAKIARFDTSMVYKVSFTISGKKIRRNFLKNIRKPLFYHLLRVFLLMLYDFSTKIWQNRSKRWSMIWDIFLGEIRWKISYWFLDRFLKQFAPHRNVQNWPKKIEI